MINLRETNSFLAKKHKEEYENCSRNESHDQSFLLQTFCGVYPLEEEEDDKNDCDYAPGNITKPLKKKQKFHYLTVVDEASDPLPFKYHHIRNGMHDVRNEYYMLMRNSLPSIT